MNLSKTVAATLSLALAGQLLACAKRSSKQTPGNQTSGMEAIQASSASLVSRQHSEKGGGKELHLAQFKENEFNVHIVSFTFPRTFLGGAHIYRTLNGAKSEIQLSAIKNSGPEQMTGEDRIELEDSNPFSSVELVYHWQFGDKIVELRPTLKKNWYINSLIDLRKVPLASPNLAIPKDLRDELNLEHLIIGERGKLIIGSRTLKIRANVIQAERGGQIVAFDNETLPLPNEVPSAGNVYLQAEKLHGRLLVRLDGANGRTGAKGADRLPTERGATGTPGQGLSISFGGPAPCAQVKPSGQGGPGPQGHPGGRGEDGGAGGSFTLRSPAPAALEIEFASLPGAGGVGGPGGKGGPGGIGGSGTPRPDGGACGVPDGPVGPQGPVGPVGETGNASTIRGVYRQLPIVNKDTPLSQF